MVMGQTQLPDDPMENTSGSRFLRLSHECPKQGIVVSLEKPSISDSRFKTDDGAVKKEYQWPCTIYLPNPVEKILTESSPGFCGALKKATNGQPYGKIILIKWIKAPNSRGQATREWTIREINEADIARIFAEG